VGIEESTSAFKHTPVSLQSVFKANLMRSIEKSGQEDCWQFTQEEIQAMLKQEPYPLFSIKKGKQVEVDLYSACKEVILG